MHTNRTTLALTASLLVSGLAACSNAPGEPQQPPAEPTAPADPFQIDQPKNLKAINDPCQLLTPQQLQQLGTSDPKPGKSEWGQAQCRWSNRQLSVTIAPDTIQRGGLEYTAKTVADGKPTAEIAGYPAVHYGVSSGSCGTYVGTSDEELFLVNYQTSTEEANKSGGPCKAADRIADMVVSNLPPA